MESACEVTPPASPNRFCADACGQWDDGCKTSQSVEVAENHCDESLDEEPCLDELECSIGTGRQCAGLMNLGNTCFLNAVVQCLTYTVPFCNQVIGSQHKTKCKSKTFCAMCALEDHINMVFSAFGRTISPSYLADNLNQISKSFILGQQQDAHEYFLFLIDVLTKCCTSESQIDSKSSPNDKCFVSDIFIGQLKSQVKCNSCSHTSDSKEDFLGINLDIENCYSINEALINFTSLEALDEDTKISCSNCKGLVSVTKQLTFQNAPQVLVIQLKRFKVSSFFTKKIDSYIKYGNSLDLTPFISRQGDDSQEAVWKYRLYAVLVHSGCSTTSGHYYCYVQTAPGTWHCMNDSSVTRVSEKTALQQKAYMLFYIRDDIKDALHQEVAPSLLVPVASPSFNVRNEAIKRPIGSPLCSPLDVHLQRPAKRSALCSVSSLTDVHTPARVYPQNESHKLTSANKCSPHNESHNLMGVKKSSPHNAFMELSPENGDFKSSPQNDTLRTPNVTKCSPQNDTLRTTNVIKSSTPISVTKSSLPMCVKPVFAAQSTSEASISKQPGLEIKWDDPILKSEMSAQSDVSKSVKKEKTRSTPLTKEALQVSLLSCQEFANDSDCTKHNDVELPRDAKLLKANNTPSPINQKPVESLPQGSHSFMKLLKHMPSGRRSAFLASAFSSQDSSPANVSKSPNQPDFLQKLNNSNEKMPRPEHIHVGGSKQQRAGGKRIMASSVDLGVHH